MVDLTMKKRFLTRLNFYDFLRKKVSSLSHLLHADIKTFLKM